jgi:hypothetical protein
MLKVSSKLLLLWIGIIATLCGGLGSNMAAAIVAAGAFIAFAILEVQEMKILNEKDKEEE